MQLPWPPPVNDGSLRHRLNIDISIKDHNLIRTVIPDHGFISLVIQTFHHDIASLIRSHGYTYADYDTVIAIIRQRADSRFTGNPSPRNERDPASGVHADPSVPANLKSSDAKTTPDRQRVEKIRKAKARLERQKTD